MSDLYDFELDELRAQTRAENRYRNALIAHPDCRDPDHPGCALCADEEEA